MTAKNNVARGKNPYMAGSVFLGMLAALFMANVLIRFPFQKPVSIAENGAACLEVPGKRWFILESGSYTVEGSFETISIRSSSIPLLSKKHSYFSVRVTSGAGSFVMPVRVNAKKAGSLESGSSVALYGMVSKMSANLCEKQNQALGGQAGTVIPMCLNDNEDTVATRLLSAAVFALLTVGCTWLAVKIYKVKV